MNLKEIRQCLLKNLATARRVKRRAKRYEIALQAKGRIAAYKVALRLLDRRRVT